MRLSNEAATPSSTLFVPLYTPSFSYRLRSALRAMTGRSKSSCAGAFDSEIRTEPATAREAVEVAFEPMTQPAPVRDVQGEAFEIVAEEAPVSLEDETPAPQVGASQLQRPTAPVPNRIPARATRGRTAPDLAAQRRRRTSAAARTNMAVEKTARSVHLDR